MNVVFVVCLVILALFAVSGLLKGFIRKASGVIALVLAGILVNVFLPSVTSWLYDSTGVYSFVRKQCQSAGEKILERTVSDTAFGMTGEAAPGAGDSSSAASPEGEGGGQSGSVDREQIRSILEQNGYDGSIIDGMTDEQIQSYISQYAGISAGAVGISRHGAYAGAGRGAFRWRNGGKVPGIQLLCLHGVQEPGGNPTYISVRERREEMTAPIRVCRGSDLLYAGVEKALPALLSMSAEAAEGSDMLSALSDSLSAADQRRFIESLPIPDSLKEQMETFNNGEGYARLGADSFSSYVVNYFAGLITNLIAYAVTFLLIWIAVRLILFILQIFTKLPLIGAADRVGGLVLGLVQGIMLIWALFAVTALFSATQPGTSILNQIYANPLLELLYNTDIFMNGASHAMKGILT